LATKLHALQRALEDVTVAREMLAEAEERRENLRSELGADIGLIRSLFADKQGRVKRRYRPGTIHRIRRHVWLEPILKVIKDGKRPMAVWEVAAPLKGTPAEAGISVVGSRLKRLADDKLIIRINPVNGDRLGVRYEAVKLTPQGPPPSPPSIIHRHHGRGDGASYDHRAVN
jgi:hypothetical protein